MGLSIFSLCFLLVVVNATMKDEMDALEKDLESTLALKKSVQDLSTDELIEELKKEIESTKKTIYQSHKDKFDSLTLAQKKSVEDEEEKLWQDAMLEMDSQMSDYAEQDYKICADKRSTERCEQLKSYCQNEKYKYLMAEMCNKTCGYCTAKCTDNPNINCKIRERMCSVKPLRMQNLCPKTCGYCKAAAPPKCSGTQFGCCWDKQTTKLDIEGRNCPHCVDQYQYVCKTFQPDCDRISTAGDFMRKHCPNSCALCSSKCVDDVKKSYFCGFWESELNWCTVNKETMKHFCPKTCNFC